MSPVSLAAGGKQETSVTAQVHQPDYSPAALGGEAVAGLAESPVPLLPAQQEKVYSFNTLREKCRKMIAGSKPFPARTRL